MCWIKLHTKIKDWRWWGDSPTMCVWIHILIEANWKDKPWKNITVPRGSLVTSREHLAESCGLSVMQVRRALDNLISTGEITKTATNKYTIISICKYEDYQLSDIASYPTNNQQITNKQPQPKNNRKKDNISTNTLIDNNNLIASNKGRGVIGGKQTEVCPAPLNPQYQNFVSWCEKNAQEVLKMKHPMTEEQFCKLHQEFGSRALADIVGEMSNWEPLRRKNTSAYLTALKWLKGRRAETDKGQPKSKFAETAEQMARMAERMDEREKQQREQESQIDYGALRQISEV